MVGIYRLLFEAVSLLGASYLQPEVTMQELVDTSSAFNAQESKDVVDTSFNISANLSSGVESQTIARTLSVSNVSRER
jgi:hypothetical protein